MYLRPITSVYSMKEFSISHNHKRIAEPVTHVRLHNYVILNQQSNLLMTNIHHR